jgi:hypothetical protein
VSPAAAATHDPAVAHVDVLVAEGDWLLAETPFARLLFCILDIDIKARPPIANNNRDAAKTTLRIATPFQHADSV